MRKIWLTVFTCCLLLLPLTAAGAEGQSLRLLAINVGKADALLLFSGEDTYLIDTGTWDSYPALCRALWANQVDHLSGVIITHADKDHVGGAWALAQSAVEIDAWYTSAYCAKYTAAEHPAVLAAALRGMEVIPLKSGDSLPMDGGALTMLGPTEAQEKENNNSVVLLAEGGGGTMLLAGDMEFPEETLLAEAGLLRRVDVLKVGNHANSDATSDAFAELVCPRVAVVSTNTEVDSGTLAKRVTKALKAVGAQIAVTQSAAQGVEVILENGEVEVNLLSWPEQPPLTEGIALISKNYSADTITLANKGTETVDLGGWFILSEKGSQTFVFPQGTTLDAGQVLVVSSLSSTVTGDLVWPESGVWKKNNDPATLYDAYGRMMDELE